MIKEREDFKCECGQRLQGRPTIFMTTEQIVCPNCGKKQYIERVPIDWEYIASQSAKAVRK